MGRGGEVAYKTITFQSTSISDNSTINNNNENLDDDEAALLSLIGGKKWSKAQLIRQKEKTQKDQEGYWKRVFYFFII